MCIRDSTSGEPFLLEIQGNSYGQSQPFNLKWQGYIYNDTIINCGGTSLGPTIPGCAFLHNGVLNFYLPCQAYWQGYSVQVNDSYSGQRNNRVTGATNSAFPSSGTSKVVNIQCSMRCAISSSGGHSSYLNGTLCGNILCGWATTGWSVATQGCIYAGACVQAQTLCTLGNATVSGHLGIGGFGSHATHPLMMQAPTRYQMAICNTNATTAYYPWLWHDTNYFGIHFNGIGDRMCLDTNGWLCATGCVKSPTLCATSHSRMSNCLLFDQNYGIGIFGLYSSTRYQHVWSMGTAYKQASDGTSLGNLYGLSFTHSNIGGQSKAGLEHQLLLVMNGTTRSAIGTGMWTCGTLCSVLSSGYGVRSVGCIYSAGKIVTSTCFYSDCGLYSSHQAWSGEQNKIQWHSTHLYFQNTSSGHLGIFRRADGSNRLIICNDGTLCSTGHVCAASHVYAGSHLNTVSNNATTTVPSRFYASNDNYVRYYDRQHMKMHLGMTGKYNHGRSQNTSDTNYWVGSMGYGTVNLDTIFHYGSGFWDSWGNPANQPSGTSHWNGINALHYTTGSTGYGFQMAVGAGNPGLMYVRGKWGSGAFTGWAKMWNACNDGASSGLDADLLDGNHASAFATGNYAAMNCVSGTYNLRFQYSNEFNLYNGSTPAQQHINYRGGGTHISRALQVDFQSNTHSYYALTVAGDITAHSSDRRLKCNIVTIKCATDRIKSIRGVEFEWDRKYICDNNLPFIPYEKCKTLGFIAQELENTISTAVREAPFETGLCRTVSWAEKYKTVKPEKITPVLVEAFKEQQCIIEKQQRQIDTLTCQVELLLKRCA